MAWHSRDDPVLSVAPAVALDMYEALNESQLFPSRQGSHGYWEQLFHLQAAYLLLWTVYERLTAFRYGPALDPVTRINKLQADPRFVDAFRDAGCQGGYTVYSSRNLDKVTVGPDGEKAMAAWYMARLESQPPRKRSAWRPRHSGCRLFRCPPCARLPASNPC